jgi:hypothetical protein
MKTNPNDPVYSAEKWAEAGNEGLTKREYFAATAMQALASIEYNFLSIELAEARYGIDAKNAVKYADALIEELNKEK